MMKVILASNNPKKIEDLKTLCKNFSVEVSTLSELGITDDIEEFGETFYQNALIKTETISKLYPDSIVISDDSGLCINSLNGEPGVYSARYSGKGDIKNIKLVLEKMEGIEDRSAFFISTICVKFPDLDPMFVHGKVEGTILNQALGTNGFGYDPIFSVDNKTSFAQLTHEEKNKLSHRSIAFDKLMKLKSWEDYA